MRTFSKRPYGASVSNPPPKSRVPTWLAVLVALVVIFIVGSALLETVCGDQQGFSCGG